MWWNLVAFPVELLETYPLHQFLTPILDDLQLKIDSHCRIWDAYTDERIFFRAEVIGVTGDLQGRNKMFCFMTSFASMLQWCNTCMGHRNHKMIRDSPLRTTEKTIQQGNINGIERKELKLKRQMLHPSENIIAR